MSGADGSSPDKVLGIFADLVGDRAVRRDGSVLAAPTMDAIARALAPRYGAERAEDIGFHMADWNSDAAFIVALHLFPERFSPAEVEDGIGLFLGHAPNHIREACRLTETYVWKDFGEDDEVGADELG